MRPLVGREGPRKRGPFLWYNRGMEKPQRKRTRKYTGVLQYFHNFEHSNEGRNHCKGPASNPYTIRHSNGKHIISLSVAVGHGKGKKRQWFKFARKLEEGYDMASGVKIEGRP